MATTAAARPPPSPGPSPTMVIQDDYIDMDLTPTATPLASPRFEFQSAGGGGKKRQGEEEAAFASPADELFYKGNLLPLHLPPRLQLVQRLLREQTPPPTQQVGVKRREAESSDNAARDGGAAAVFDVDAAVKVAKTKPPPFWSMRRLKVVKRWATSREYIRSLFLARRSGSGAIVVDGNGSGSVNARVPAALEDRDDGDEVCRHRKSFSGIIRRVRLVATTTTKPSVSAPGVSPPSSFLSSSSSTSSSSTSTPSCGTATGLLFFFRPGAPAPSPALKRSGSARGSSSEEEGAGGAIQGAIAHCKRSQQGTAARRSSASDVAFYSVNNTPRASSVEVAQERQEMCRG